jgi:hypothetical protein
MIVQTQISANGNLNLCSQIGFIDFLVNPLYDAWYSFSKTAYTSECLRNLASNREHWRTFQDVDGLLSVTNSVCYDDSDRILDVQIPSITFSKKESRASESRSSSRDAGSPAHRYGYANTISDISHRQKKKLSEQHEEELVVSSNSRNHTTAF